MKHKHKVFYRKNQAVLADFEAEGLSSDGSLLLLEKIEREVGLLKYFSEHIAEYRHKAFISHSIEKMLKQRVFLLMQGYSDANDISLLKSDAVLCHILETAVVSQPSISRFENSFDRRSIYALCEAFVERYVSSLSGRSNIIIDVDATPDATHGNQQLSLFNGHKGQFQYDELFFHDGDSGQIILPVLRPGNSHSNKWFVAILKRIVEKIRASYPAMSITIRADAGFSSPAFYKLAEEYDLKYALGMSSNSVLKKRVDKLTKAVKLLYADKQIKHQHFTTYTYKAASWNKEQTCYAKIESTGKAMNVRHLCSNLEDLSAQQIYTNFYVKRGDASENRIKEVKNSCFSDRLSNHSYWANFFRLLLSAMAYEFFLIIKNRIRKTTFEKAKKWQIDSIRTYLLKINTSIKITKKRVYYSFSKTCLYTELFAQLLVYQ